MSLPQKLQTYFTKHAKSPYALKQVHVFSSAARIVALTTCSIVIFATFYQPNPAQSTILSFNPMTTVQDISYEENTQRYWLRESTTRFVITSNTSTQKLLRLSLIPRPCSPNSIQEVLVTWLAVTRVYMLNVGVSEIDLPFQMSAKGSELLAVQFNDSCSVGSSKYFAGLQIRIINEYFGDR